jgi:glycolate oxidase FAD binding subunit
MSATFTANNSLGLPADRTLAPTSIEEACRAVAEADRAGQAVYPVGGGVSIDYGLPAAKPGVVLQTTGLAEIDDYPSDDMTITVGAGIRWSQLLSILAQKGQTLPIDVPSPDQATLGGVIATNTSGPRRFGHGTMRDYLLGVDVVSAEGKRVHGGGRVVKNVAGYDFMKMHTGALGTLGVVVQATLKLKPIPEAKAAVVATIDAAQMEKVLARLVSSATRPVACSLWNRAAGASANRQLLLLYEENRPAVDWQIITIQRELAETGVADSQVMDGAAYDQLLKALTDWPQTSTAEIVFKANLTPSGVAPFCELAEQTIPKVAILAHAGNGVVWGSFDARGDLEPAKSALTSLRRFAGQHHGNLVVPRCPADGKSSLTIWGEPEPSFVVMQKLKAALDPNDTLNPGRFVPSAPADSLAR